MRGVQTARTNAACAIIYVYKNARQTKPAENIIDNGGEQYGEKGIDLIGKSEEGRQF